MVDNKDVQHDVVLIDVHIGLGIHGVREPCQLNHLERERGEETSDAREQRKAAILKKVRRIKPCKFKSDSTPGQLNHLERGGKKQVMQFAISWGFAGLTKLATSWGNIHTQRSEPYLVELCLCLLGVSLPTAHTAALRGGHQTQLILVLSLSLLQLRQLEEHDEVVRVDLNLLFILVLRRRNWNGISEYA